MEELIERLEKESKGNAYLSAIADHIIQRANGDAKYFAKANGFKLSDVFDKVKEKAKRQAKNGCAMIRDDTVYAWVDEIVANEKPKPVKVEVEDDDEEIEGNPIKMNDKPVKIDIEAECDKSRSMPKKPAKKEKKKPGEDMQMSIFDFMA